MARVAVVFEGTRTGYSIEQVLESRSVMTVGELRDALEYYDDEDLFVLSNDNGYTFGTIYLLGEAVEEDGDWN